MKEKEVMLYYDFNCKVNFAISDEDIYITLLEQQDEKLNILAFKESSILFSFSERKDIGFFIVDCSDVGNFMIPVDVCYYPQIEGEDDFKNIRNIHISILDDNACEKCTRSMVLSEESSEIIIDFFRRQMKQTTYNSYEEFIEYATKILNKEDSKKIIRDSLNCSSFSPGPGKLS